MSVLSDAYDQKDSNHHPVIHYSMPLALVEAIQQEL